MEDFYISFLRDLMNCPKTWDEIKEKYPNKHEAIWLEVRDKHLLVQGSDEKYHLSFEARFKLLEYEELFEARRSSQKAQRTSIGAIIVAVIAIIISIILGYQQLYFNKNQDIMNNIYSIEYLNKIDKLNDLITNNGKILYSNFATTNDELETINQRLEYFETILINKKDVGTQ